MRATNADLPEIVALVEACLAEYGHRIAPDSSEADLLDVERSYHAAGGTFELVRDGDGRLVGCCGVYPVGERAGKLRKMYVAAEARGRGIGRVLLERALECARARGWRELRLETTDGMRDARRLYERAGFRLVEGARAESPRCDRVYRLRLSYPASGASDP